MTKIYCHVCKAVREYPHKVLSVRDYREIENVSYPVLTCGTPTHTGEEIRASYKLRMEAMS